jgi:prolyl oligopeptidase
VTYPPAPQSDQIDTRHDIAIPDPYRPLEDANSAPTRAWVAAENAVTAAYLQAIPERATLLGRITELMDYEKFGIPFRRGSRYFYVRNTGLQNQSVLFVAEALDADPRALLDPNTLSADGTVALSGTAVSEDGALIAYGIAVAGSDWQQWRVRDVATGEDRPDDLRWIKFSGAAWTRDGAGFFYSRYDEPAAGQSLMESNHFHKVYYHRLGEPQSADRLIYDRPDRSEWNLTADVTDDGRFLLLYGHAGATTKTALSYVDLGPDGADIGGLVTPLIEVADAAYGVIGNDGRRLYVQTDRDAPLGRVIAIRLEAPNPADWTEILPEGQDKLEEVGLFGDELYTRSLHDASSRIAVYGIDGAFKRDIALPGIGTAYGFHGRRRDRETFYSFTSFTRPGSSYRYDLDTGESTLFRTPSVQFSPDDYETEQVFYASKDGTRIPMFLTYRRGLTRNGENPTYLYGYGGFNASMTPAFSPTMVAWIERGGIYAVANLRGGGEYGEEWHQAGMKHKKQNVFDDFIAAGEWLIAQGFTSPAKLAISGGSNGGLLVGACLNQRPDLFGAALPAVGVMDMLRFDQFTIGWAWKDDYGDPAYPADFAALRAYSPLHNIRAGTRYPATLITTSDHDDRVVPAHSYKFAAALQAAQAPDGPPILIRIETKAGHGAGKPTAKVIEEAADRLAFLAHNLGLPAL